MRYNRYDMVLHQLSNNPGSYLQDILQIGLLPELFPEIYHLVGLDQTSPYHLEDAFTHTIKVIENLPKQASKELKLAAVFHDIGKTNTQIFDSKNNVFHFYGHDKESVKLFLNICDRFGWDDTCFDQTKVIWLIDNHVKVQLDCESLANPHKTIEKLFFKSKMNGADIPASFRRDLLALRKADSAGAEVEDPAIKASKENNLQTLNSLMVEVEENIRLRERKNREKNLIQSHWNGKIVHQHFNASGPNVGKLVRKGQQFVEQSLERGSPPPLEEILSHVKNTDLT